MPPVDFRPSLIPTGVLAVGDAIDRGLSAAQHGENLLFAAVNSYRPFAGHGLLSFRPSGKIDRRTARRKPCSHPVGGTSTD